MVRRMPGGFLALTPGRATNESQTTLLLASIGRAFEAGLPAVMLREPNLCDRDFLTLGRQVMELTQRFPGTWVGVHDRVHVARELKSDGVHLGFRSLPIAEARRQLPDSCAIGFSGHAGDVEDDWRGADYLCFGPVKDTPSKRGVLEPTGFEGLREAAGRTETPLLALGGMTPADVAPAIAAGAAGVAVLSGALGAVDVARAVADYLAAFETAHGKKR